MYLHNISTKCTGLYILKHSFPLIIILSQQQTLESITSFLIGAMNSKKSFNWSHDVLLLLLLLQSLFPDLLQSALHRFSNPRYIRFRSMLHLLPVRVTSSSSPCYIFFTPSVTWSTMSSVDDDDVSESLSSSMWSFPFRDLSFMGADQRPHSMPWSGQSNV